MRVKKKEFYLSIIRIDPTTIKADPMSLFLIPVSFRKVPARITENITSRDLTDCTTAVGPIFNAKKTSIRLTGPNIPNKKIDFLCRKKSDNLTLLLYLYNGKSNKVTKV